MIAIYEPVSFNSIRFYSVGAGVCYVSATEENQPPNREELQICEANNINYVRKSVGIDDTLSNRTNEVSLVSPVVIQTI